MEAARRDGPIPISILLSLIIGWFAMRHLPALHLGDSHDTGALNFWKGEAMIAFFHRAASATLLWGTIAGLAPCAAQNAPAPQMADPKACSDDQRLRLGNGSAPQPLSPSNQPLSEKLERSEGVICPPPGVDPKILERPPGGGQTPIIPPPGTPGGDPRVRPK